MADYTNTRLWQTSLAPQPGDPEQGGARERLRNDFSKFRSRAATIAGEIARDLPEFTVHDATHIDALWEMATLIAGDDFTLTPTEAFVLGGAFLIHDLGMGLAAFPDGREALKRDPSWKDIVTAQLKKKLGRVPTETEQNHPDKDVEVAVITELLRLRHAKQAEQLAVAEYTDSTGRDKYHLIEDPELRKAFGAVIGQIAHSHWWSIDEVRERFAALKPLYPPALMGCPGNWTVDRLKLACLLRTADAIHLDGRRAPGFLRALRKPEGYADLHWTFQQNVNLAGREEGQERVIFTSGYEFTVEEAPAWWVGYELLQTADKELRQVDILFQDLERKYRFVARGVAGVEEPERLRQHIPTHNWTPVDARIQVSNVAALVRNLGGEQLYGSNQTVPLRELVQNASDAVRARRLLEKCAEDWGDVVVRMGEDEHGHWIEVDDSGVGMSPYVLTGPFLDFGQSFWDTPKMHEDLPGLQGTGFASTGKYGIGFFSVFMWGERVRVTTRRYEAGRDNTNVLEFYKGPASRPILRKADTSEQRSEGGTSVRVWLRTPPIEKGGLLYQTAYRERKNFLTLQQLCGVLCPAVDINLYAQSKDEAKTLVVSANDWITMDGKTLLERINTDWYEEDDEPDDDEGNNVASSRIDLSDLACNLRLLKDEADNIIGRACIYKRSMVLKVKSNLADIGVVTVGGFRSAYFTGIVGIMHGISDTSARDNAIPAVPQDALAHWATEQAVLLDKLVESEEHKVQCAAVVRLCGGDTGTLPVAFSSEGWASAADISAIASSYNEILLLHDVILWLSEKYAMNMQLQKNVLAVGMGVPGVLQTRNHSVHWPSSSSIPQFYSQSLEGLVIEAAAKSWGCSSHELGRDYDRRKSSRRTVGSTNGQPTELDAYVLRKPTANS